jgi:hypothetical protein
MRSPVPSGRPSVTITLKFMSCARADKKSDAGVLGQAAAAGTSQRGVAPPFPPSLSRGTRHEPPPQPLARTDATARCSSASTTLLCPCVRITLPGRMKRAPSSAIVARARVDVSANRLPRCVCTRGAGGIGLVATDAAAAGQGTQVGSAHETRCWRACVLLAAPSSCARLAGCSTPRHHLRYHLSVLTSMSRVFAASKSSSSRALVRVV